MATYRESVVVYIACDPPALLWSGVGLLPLPADAVLSHDMIALGGKELVSVPDFQLLINGITERLDFTLSGVSEHITRLALEDAPSVTGAPVHIGVVQFDEQFQVSDVEWEAVFEARRLSISRPRMQNGTVARTLNLTIVAGDTTRSRAQFAFFTDSDQRRKYPTDVIFSHVAGINAGTSRRFGPKE